MATRTWKAPSWSRPEPYFLTSDPSTPRTMSPSTPLLRPLPNMTLDASRTATLVAVRTAVLVIVVPIESLRRDGTLGSGADAGGLASRRRGRGLGGSAGSGCGVRPRAHAP